MWSSEADVLVSSPICTIFMEVGSVAVLRADHLG